MKRQLIAILILSIGTFAGCDRKSPPTSSVDAKQAAVDAKIAADLKIASDQKASADTKIAADLKAAQDTQKAADAKIAADLIAAADMKKAADAKTAANLKAATDAKAAADAKIKADAKIAADAKAVADAASKAAQAANTAKANTLYEQLIGNIKDDEIDSAQSTLDTLDDMKATIPASLQTKIEAARITLNAKKAVSL
jgi:hypothetical protein